MIIMRKTQWSFSLYHIHFINDELAKQLYYAFVHPHILYGIELYGSTTKCNINRIQVLQNKMLKILTKTDFRASSTDLRKKMKILSVEQLHNMSLALFVYKQQNNILPHIFEDKFVLNKNARTRSTRQDGNIMIKAYKTNFGYNTVQCLGAKLWNSLTVEMRHSNSFNIFKKTLAEYLLEK